jgi:hypothetical protein
VYGELTWATESRHSITAAVTRYCQLVLGAQFYSFSLGKDQRVIAPVA